MHTCFNFECQRLGIANQRFFRHAQSSQITPRQCERESEETADFISTAARAFAGVSRITVLAGVLSSFGYLLAGTSLRNVAPSHPARITEEPVTKLRISIR